jgi:hypothetical protein
MRRLIAAVGLFAALGLTGGAVAAGTQAAAVVPASCTSCYGLAGLASTYHDVAIRVASTYHDVAIRVVSTYHDVAIQVDEVEWR